MLNNLRNIWGVGFSIKENFITVRLFLDKDFTVYENIDFDIISLKKEALNSNDLLKKIIKTLDYYCKINISKKTRNEIIHIILSKFQNLFRE